MKFTVTTRLAMLCVLAAACTGTETVPLSATPDAGLVTGANVAGASGTSISPDLGPEGDGGPGAIGGFDFGPADAGVVTPPAGCSSNADCVDDPGGAFCEVATGQCTQCLVDLDCSGETPACVSGVCASCAQAGQDFCSLVSAMTPMCDDTSGACVGCLSQADCGVPNADNTTPVCFSAAQTCGSCSSDEQCGPDLVCSVSGACVECTADSECTIDAPSCINGSCSPCDASGSPDNASCVIHSSQLEICSSELSSCVQCTDNIHCADSPLTPVCTSNSCEKCTSNEQCSGVGLCNADGTCASQDDVALIDPARCSFGDEDGSVAKPYCTFPADFDNGVLRRRVFAVRGRTSALSILPWTEPFTIVGLDSTSEIPSLVLGTVTRATLRDVRISGLLHLASTAGSRASLDLHRVSIAGPGAGLFVRGGAHVTIVNSRVVSSDLKTWNRSPTSSVRWTSMLFADTASVTMAFSTVGSESNSASVSSVTCRSSVKDRDPTTVFSATSNFVSNGQSECIGLAQGICCSDLINRTTSYDLLPNSACQNVLDSGPALDIYGNSRPRGEGYDCGAHEL